MEQGKSSECELTTNGLFQVYGPTQYPEKLVSKFIVRALRGMPLPIHGTGSQKRGFVYVDDVARAFDLIVRKGACGGFWME